MLPRIHAFFDTNGLEICLPKLLEKLLILVHQTFVQHPRNQMGFTAVIIKRDSRHLLQVIIKSVTAFHVVNNPLLIGKTVFEMVNRQRERIILRFESGKECTVGSFLETDKLHQVHVRHPLSSIFAPIAKRPDHQNWFQWTGARRSLYGYNEK